MKKALLFFTMLMVSVSLAYAQQRQVSGKVTGDDGAPVPFATIQIKGTTRGTTANENGVFKLTVPEGGTLIIRAVSYQQKEISPGKENDLKIILTATSATLDEVVVTALGLKRSAASVGYSVAKIDNASLTAGKVTNLATGLSAKVSGLQINLVNNGVNPQTRVVLRGNRSLTGNNQALIVVDGVPVPSSVLNTLNPNDVESVNVLKGSNAAALYGSDGVNGVLIITTKKGKDGTATVTFSNTTSLEKVMFMPKMQYDFGAGYDLNTYVAFENTSWGPKFDGSMKDVGPKLADGSQYQLPYSPLRDEKMKFWNTGLTVQNDVSVSGGDDKSTFFLSLQDVNVKGVVPKDKYRRTGGRFNGSRRIGKLNAAFNLSYNSGTQDYTINDVYNQLLNIPQNIPITKLKDWQNNKFANPDGYFSGYFINPYWAIDNNRELRRTDVFSGNVELNYQVAPWFEVLYRVGLTNEAMNYKNYYKKVSYTTAYDRPANNPGNVKDYASQARTVNTDLLLSFNKNIGDFSAKLILGNNIRDVRFKEVKTEASALVIPDLYNVSNRLGEAIAGESNTLARQTAVFADLTLGYKNFLYLGLTGRNEWVSRLSKENRSYFYPGSSLSFVFSEAIPAIKESNLLSFGKLTVSANKTANVILPVYNLNTPFEVGAGFPFGSLPGFTQTDRNLNPNIEPEFVKSLEFGMQLGFLKDRINLEANYFTTRVDGPIVPISTSWSTGFSSAFVNAGSMSVKGVELDLKVTPFKTPDFSWEVGLNATFIKNKVLELYQGVNEIPLGGYENSAYVYAIKGEEYPTMKVTGYKRDPQGRIVVNGTTGNPIRAAAMIPVGNTNPRTRLGFNTTVRYKNISLSTQLDYRTGNIFYNRIANTMDFTGLSWHSAQYDRMPFVVPNSSIEKTPGTFEPNTNVKTADGGFDYWYQQYRNVQENYVADATFLKMRELSVTYEFPKTLLARQNMIKRASFSLVGRNLFMFLPKENRFTDPEFNFTDGNAVGISSTAQTPPTRIFGANLTVTF